MSDKSNVLALLATMVLLTASGYDLHTRSLTPIAEDAPPVHAPVPLVRGGELDFVLVTDTRAEAATGISNRTEKSIGPAVTLLADAFEAATGKRPAVVDAADAQRLKEASHWFVVGDCALARREGVDVNRLPPAGFALRTFSRGVILAGWDSSTVAGYNLSKLNPRGAALGTFYGAVDFTERFLGCRYYFPGPYGCLHPAVRDLTIRPVAYSDAPYFDLRGDPYYYHCSVNKDAYFSCPCPADEQQARYRAALGDGMKNMGSFLRLWRLGSTNPPGGYHCPSPQSLAKIYPDKDRVIFYTSPNGKHWRNDKAHIGNYYNVWDLGFADLLVNAYTNYLATGDATKTGTDRWNATYMSFGVCDTYMPYQDVLDDPIVKSLNLMTPADIARGRDAAFANIYGRFYQYLGRRLMEAAPASRLYLLIYYNSSYASLDPRWRLPENVEINFCSRGMPGGVHSPETLAENNRMMEEWYVALGNRPAMRTWLYNNRHNAFVRAVNPEFIGPFVQAARKYLNRQGGLFFDYDGGWDIWHNYYSAYAGLKSQWNPDFDVDAAIDEHWDAFYGTETGPHLRHFHRVLKNAVIARARKGKAAFTLSIVDELERSLNAAGEALKAGTVERMRYELIAAPWPRAFAQFRSMTTYRPPVYRVKRLSGPDPHAAPWTEIAPMPMADTKGAGTQPRFVSRFRLGWTDRGIVGRFEGDYAPAANPEKDFWANDCVEMFLSPGLGKEVNHMLAFDATGRWYTEKERRLPIPQPPDNTWKPLGTKLNVSRSASGWSAEFFIPFSALECAVPSAGAEWNFNAVRNKISDPHECVGSSLTGAVNHDVTRYGILRFE